ncbi:porin family protein [Niabella ginsenosidivorans]|nr:porin family protein [Niabella ginsenosidivorans]
MFRKLLFTCMLAGTSCAVFSQVQFGLRAGINFSNAIVKDENGNKMPTNLLTGFHVGITADLPVGDEFAVQPALLFNTMGYQYKEMNSGVSITVNQHPYYLELPVQFLYKPELGNGHLLLGAGPCIAYGISGRWKVKGTDGNTTVSKTGNLEFKNNISSTDSSYLNFNDLKTLPYGKAFDLGGTLLAGYEFSNKFSVQLNGQLGLLNIAPDVDNRKTGEVLKNMQFGLSVGYKF